MTKAKLKAVEPPLAEPQHEAREELAAAIKAVKTAETELTRLSSAVERAEQNRREAEGAIEAAQATLTQATENQARLYEAAIEQGHPAGRDSSVQEARARLNEAKDELAAARSATDGLTAKRDEADLKLAALRASICELARQIAAFGVPQLLEEAKAMQLELEGKRQVLTFLGQFAPDAIHKEVQDYIADRIFPYGFNGEDTEEHPAVVPWLRTIEALTSEAGSPLPSEGR